MNTPETIYHQLLDSFTSSHVCFALYRLPWTDEPILVMQEEGEPEYIHSLNELNQKKGVTILLITHYMEEVVDADYVYVMDKGHVVMQGTPREIFSQVGTLKEHRLDVPQITLLADLLRQSGLDIPLGVLTREELVDAIMKIAG